MKPIGPLIAIALAIATSPAAYAHCDGLDGPVVKAAEKAIATGDVNLVLIWVESADEAEIRNVFAQTLEVRKLNAKARDLADRFFFETLVRVHRAGEGAPYIGLKPAGRDLGPAIPAADKALHDKTVEPLVELLTETISRQVRTHFNETLEKMNFAVNDTQSGRKFVEAYVKYIHCVEGLYEQATKEVHGHFTEPTSTPAHHKP